MLRAIEDEPLIELIGVDEEVVLMGYGRDLRGGLAVLNTAGRVVWRNNEDSPGARADGRAQGVSVDLKPTFDDGSRAIGKGTRRQRAIARLPDRDVLRASSRPGDGDRRRA